MEISAELVKHHLVGDRMCTCAELEVLLKNAYPIGCRAAHGQDTAEISLIGTVQRENYLYDVYQDKEGYCWYDVRVITKHGIVSEFEAIFGYPEGSRKMRRRKR